MKKKKKPKKWPPGDLFRLAQRQKERRAMWREKFSTLTADERRAMVSYPSEASEFEVQAFVYRSLLDLGWLVRGEVKTACGTCRLGLVVYGDRRVPVRVIEVKKRADDAGGESQSRRYGEFGYPVTLIRGMAEAEAFVAACDVGVLPDPTDSEESRFRPGQTVTLTAEMIAAGLPPGGVATPKQMGLIGCHRSHGVAMLEMAVGWRVDALGYRKFLRLGERAREACLPVANGTPRITSGQDPS